MAEQPTDSPVHKFLLNLDALSLEKARVRCDQIQQSLQNLAEPIQARDFCKIVDFCADQLGRWEAEWLFSPASTPDSDAAREKEAWAAAWKIASDTLIEAYPATRDILTRSKQLVSLGHVMEKRMEYNKGKPVTKFACDIFSRMGLRLFRIGLTSIGHAIYKRALYPSGTVGRANG